MSGFNVQVFSNEFLPPGSGEVHAVVTVRADGTVATGPAIVEAIEVLVLDSSGSMKTDGRIHEARRALAAAVNQIRDGVWFSVVAGTELAQLVYPHPSVPGYHSGAVRSDANTRAQALEAIRHVQADGGTAISTWLDAAAGIVNGFPGAIHHVLLVTDGKNESEPAQALLTALARYQGLFQVDCRGVGANWSVDELRSIAQAFLGTVDIIPQPQEMAEEFKAIMDAAMGKAVASVELRVWTPQHAELLFVKQVAPIIEDLTARATAGPNPLTRDFPTGAWGAEERDYHVAVRVNPAGVGEEMLAARISLVIDDQPISQGLVRAVWSADELLTARINPEVAHYTGQQELASAIAEGLAARQAGNEDEATTKLGRAVQLAAAAGNDATTRLLAQVVDIDNAESGTVRLKRNAEQLDLMALDTRSTKTTRVRPASS
ncbi:MAG: VWA domain-containing protein [Acidimicrobiales bacterium]